MSNGMKAWTKIHDNISATATSADIDCRGYNALAISAQFSAAQNWTFSILGGRETGGTFVQCYDNAATAMSKQTNADIFIIFRPVPDWVQVKANEDVNGANVTVWAAPCQV